MSQDINVQALRQKYESLSLEEDKVDQNPFKQFQIWFEEATAADFIEPNAMNIATVSLKGEISSRMVLLKTFDEKGFVFFTNYNSSKAQDLFATKTAALNIWWDKLFRQVRIQGQVQKISQDESKEYFHSRPRGSQLGAIASSQSDVIDSYKILEDEYKRLEQQYNDKDVPYPDYWGGFCVVPNLFEFWQGRPNRLHDRLRYKKTTSNWKIERLSP